MSNSYLIDQLVFNLRDELMEEDAHDAVSSELLRALKKYIAENNLSDE
jgi:hypothetical protein